MRKLGRTKENPAAAPRVLASACRRALFPPPPIGLPLALSRLCGHGPTPPPIRVYRAAVLTLWATVVAERLS